MNIHQLDVVVSSTLPTACHNKTDAKALNESVIAKDSFGKHHINRLDLWLIRYISQTMPLIPFLQSVPTQHNS